jgi:hypothetical protein
VRDAAMKKKKKPQTSSHLTTAQAVNLSNNLSIATIILR